MCAVAAAPLAPATGSALADPPIGSGDGGVHLRKIGNFDNPTYVDNAPGSKRLLFVTEQPGRIKVLRGSKILGHDFLDISDQVKCCGEEGLLSVAFAPDYKRTRRFYAYFTNHTGDNEVDEFKRSKRSRTHAAPGSERRVITFSHREFPNHNGGLLQFGPDGLLYIGTGDGGGSGDTLHNGQNVNTLLGKLLRIDPRAGGGRPYRIPASNPFAGSTPGADEIYALGLRNPWRYSFDSKTGDLIIGDVGQNQYEEIDYETNARGANFGWNVLEGNHPYAGGPTPANYHPPVLEYSHNGGACAVTGGYVVRDNSLPTLYGRYLYGDYCVGDLRSFIPNRGAHSASDDRPLGPNVPSLTSFGEGRNGHIYAASQGGPVYRLK